MHGKHIQYWYLCIYTCIVNREANLHNIYTAGCMCICYFVQQLYLYVTYIHVCMGTFYLISSDSVLLWACLSFTLPPPADVIVPVLLDPHARRCWHPADAQWPDERDIFCSVRAIKRGSGALVNTEERDSTRRQQHGSARDNMISALLGPLLDAAQGSLCGEREEAQRKDLTLHLPHGSSLLPIDMPEEVTHWQFVFHCSCVSGTGEVVSPLASSGKIISHFLCPFFSVLFTGESWYNAWVNYKSHNIDDTL